METTAGGDEAGVPVAPSVPGDDGSRSADEVEIDEDELGPIDRPLETPEADLLDQLRDVGLDDDHDR